ncbi:MAG TPA: MFS transporter, partial [Candidatus Dormibacteraeota bacterium]|nr:MFS transporter [Candidatus Dormibacteraeota bacterium]
LPGALINGMMSPITGKIFDRYGAKWLSIIGFIIITVSTLAFTNLGIGTSMLTVMILYAIRMFGISMVMMPTTTAGLNQLKESLIPHGVAMTNTLRQVAASIGTAVLVTVMTITTTASQSNPNIDDPSIHGVNVALIVLTFISAIGIVLSFFIDKSKSE